MKKRARARTMTWTENTHTSVHLLSHSKCVCLIMALRRTLHSCNHHQLPGNKEKPLPTETQHTRLHYYCYRVAEARVCACIVCVCMCVCLWYIVRKPILGETQSLSDMLYHNVHRAVHYITVDHSAWYVFEQD